MPHRFFSQFFGILFLALVLGLYLFASWVDQPSKDTSSDPVLLKQKLTETVFNTQLDAEIRAESAQALCGNAGWKISKDDKKLTCIPRQGKPYTLLTKP